jgi:hypothetical protein
MQNSNSEGKASPGQPFSAPKAEIWNSMIDAGNAHRNARLSNGTPEPTRPRQTDIIKLKNSSGASRSRGEILRINGKAITNLSDEHLWLIGSAPTDDGYFGILKEPIANGSIGQAQVSGCCMATIDIADANHTRAKAVASQYVLESSDDGPIEIVYKPSGSGELECVVRFGSDSGSLFGFRVNSGFSSGQTQAKIYRLAGASFGDFIGTFTLYDPTRWATGFLAGDIGLCQKSGGLYYAIQAPCPDDEASSTVSGSS